MPTKGSDAESSSLKIQLEEMQEALEMEKEKCSTMTEKMKDYESTIDNYKKEGASSQESIDKFKEDTAALKEQNTIQEEEIQQLKETLHMKGQNVIDLQCEVANKAKDIKECEARTTHLKKEIVTLNAENHLANTRNADLEDEIKKKQDILQKSTAFQDGIINKSKEEIKMLSQQLHEATKNIDNKDDLVDGLRAENRELGKTAEELRMTIGDISCDRDNKQADVNFLKRSLDQEVYRGEQEMKKLHTKMENQEAEIRKLHAEEVGHISQSIPVNHVNHMQLSDKSSLGEDQRSTGSSRSGHNNSKVDVPFPKPGMFSGKNWEGFIAQFNSIADYCGWDDNTRLLRLLHHVTDEASQFVYNKCDASTRESYDRLLKALKLRFGEKQTPSTYMAKLENVKFGPRDSLAEYATNIGFYVRMAWPNIDEETRNKMEVEYFVRNLGDPGMIRTVGNQKPATLEDARDLVDRYTDIEDQMKPRRNAIRAVHFEKPQPTEVPEPYATEARLHKFGEDIVDRVERQLNAQLDTKFQRLAASMNSRSPNSQRRQGPLKCYNCQQPGHMARDCPKPRQRWTPQQPPQYQPRYQQYQHPQQQPQQREQQVQQHLRERDQQVQQYVQEREQQQQVLQPGAPEYRYRGQGQYSGFQSSGSLQMPRPDLNQNGGAQSGSHDTTPTVSQKSGNE